MAIDENNVLWGWGNNNCGELGTGDTEPRNNPIQI